MSKNSPNFLNRIGIFLFSTLISGMSAANRLRTHAESKLNEPAETSVIVETESQVVSDIAENVNQRITWTSISQAFIALTIWIVMGFAAGFLIGMIRPW